MPKRKIHTNAEKAAVLSKTLLTQKDIKILYDCGSAKVQKLSDDFKEWFQKEYKQEIDCIPTDEFIKFAKYPEKRVLRYAQLGF